jgi:threonine dehydrogenase-like Zn-dependent dehydrogenase
VPYRLNLARSFGVETINFAEQDVFSELNQRLVPGGPQHCIDAAGFRFAKGPIQKLAPLVAEKIGLGATDTSDIVSEVIKVSTSKRTREHALRAKDKTRHPTPDLSLFACTHAAVAFALCVSQCCAKGGFVSLIGDYFGNADGYPVGMQMEK